MAYKYFLSGLFLLATVALMGQTDSGETFVKIAEGLHAEATEAHEKALRIRLLKLGENHADVATSYGNIGNVRFNQKNEKE